MFPGLLDHRFQFLDPKRLHQVVQGPQLDTLHRPGNGGVTGDHDDFGIRKILPEVLQQLHPVQVRQLDVQQDDAKRLTGQLGQGLGGVGGGGHRQRLLGQNPGDAGPHRGFVVHHQDLPV